MPLDPRAHRLLTMLSATTGSSGPETANDRRRSLDGLAASLGGEPLSIDFVEDGCLPVPGGERPFRRYAPKDARPGAIVFLHGGGWVAGGLHTHDGVCRQLADASGCQVIAVDYRLAPEHPFPAGLEDASAALAWTAQKAVVLNIDPGKIVIAGDSAGANLAAAACLEARALGRPPAALQLLICPILDVAEESASRRTFAEGYFLSRQTLARDLADYAPLGANLRDPRLSPLHSADHSALPPAHIHVAEFDPFRDEGLAFAERLKAAGVPTTTTLHAGMIHYFYAMPGAISAANAVLRGIGLSVRKALWP